MVHSVIAAPVRKLFERLGRQDYPFVLDGLAAHCGHSFYGRHALGGTRHAR